MPKTVEPSRFLIRMKNTGKKPDFPHCPWSTAGVEETAWGDAGPGPSCDVGIGLWASSLL